MAQLCSPPLANRDGPRAIAAAHRRSALRRGTGRAGGRSWAFIHAAQRRCAIVAPASDGHVLCPIGGDRKRRHAVPVAGAGHPATTEETLMNEQHAAPAAARARALPWLSALFLVATTACGGGGG